VLDELFTAVRLCRPDDASEIPDSSSHRRNPKKKTTIKQLFSAASKFQRTLRRGIFLACILYCDDKIFVTNEDFIPVIEIDETYPSNLNNDYYWLMKVNIGGKTSQSSQSNINFNQKTIKRLSFARRRFRAHGTMLSYCGRIWRKRQRPQFTSELNY
jgi:ankyrin repeat and fibronectin type-III domain-containing protein 1